MGISYDPVRKTHSYAFQYRGINYSKRGFKTKRAAKIARELRRKEIIAELKQIRPVIDFRTGASAYLDHAERKFVKKTYDYKNLTYREFLDMQGNPYLDDPTLPRLISEYLNSFKSNAVYNARRKELSTLFNWLMINYDLPAKNPCTKIDKMPHTPKDKQIPSPEEAMKILLVARPGDEQDIIMCCIQLMARIDEVLRLDWQKDINFEKRVVTLRTRKRKGGAYEADDIPMNEDLYNILWRRWQKKKSDKWVFFNEDTGTRFIHRPKMMASLCKRAKITPLRMSKRKVLKGKKKGKYVDFPIYYGFHTLRHFVPTHLMDKEKISLKTIQKLLRHRSPQTTEIYLHSIDESVRAAIKELEGKFTPILANPMQEPDAQKEEKG
jgi:integrase